eukprot:jgi/Pico_ML_1/54993/g119.t1
MFYERDVRCIMDWFHKQYRFEASEDTERYFSFDEVVGGSQVGLLDKELRASGFDKECEDTLEDWHRANHENSDFEDEDEDQSDEEETTWKMSSVSAVLMDEFFLSALFALEGPFDDCFGRHVQVPVSLSFPTARFACPAFPRISTRPPR